MLELRVEMGRQVLLLVALGPVVLRVGQIQNTDKLKSKHVAQRRLDQRDEKVQILAKYISYVRYAPVYNGWYLAAAPPSYLYYSLSPTQKWHLCFHIAHHQTYDKFLDGKFKYSSSQFERTFLLPPTQNGTRVSISLTSSF